MKSKTARVVVLVSLTAAAILVWLVTRRPATPTERAGSLERAEELPAAIEEQGSPGTEQVAVARRASSPEPGKTSLPPKRENSAKAPEHPVPYRLAEQLGDETKSGLRVKVVDGSGVPCSGARVWASRYGKDGLQNRMKRESAADGVVELLDLQPGKWQLSVSARELHRITKVELVGGRMTQATIEIPRVGAIMQGVARHRLKGPLAKATVRLNSHGSVFSDYLNASTGEGGGYRISAIPPGSYRVYVESDEIGYPPRQFEDLVVAAGEIVVRDLEVGVVSVG
ncbi:MAG: carboxypeptidase-like regulatory domain-containing protein [Planctomycetota bacterium]|jgi:hypothetical protein